MESRLIIAYMSNVDISQLNGPGVNEREFTWSLQTEAELRGDRAIFFIPKPANLLDFTLRNAEYYQNRNTKKSIFAAIKILSTTWHLWKLIIKRLDLCKVDLFVIRLNQNCILVPVLLILLRQKYAIKTLGNIYHFQKKHCRFKEKVYLWFLRRVLGKILENAVYVDVCTPQYYQNYKEKYSLQNIEVVENSVNTERFYIRNKKLCKKRCGLEKFNSIVGYCGGYPSLRGARQLIDISGRLITKYPNCGIVIVGEDTKLRFLKEKATQLGTDSHIVFKGVVRYEDLPCYINCMDVGIALDRDQIIDAVGNCSQKIRQYLACGVPVVCPKRTNLAIIRQGFGIAVQQSNLDEVFEAICFWLDRAKQDSEKLRQEAHEFAKLNLSAKVAFEKRYDAWGKRLGRKKSKQFEIGIS